MVGCYTPASAVAQGLDIQIRTDDPLTHLPAAKWIYLLTHVINAANLLGKNSVYLLNATGEDLSAVTCRGYYLVGPKPYITSNENIAAPAVLPKWTATIIPTEGFASYCKDGVDATNGVSTFHGTLNAADRTFPNSTFVVFWRPTDS